MKWYGWAIVLFPFSIYSQNYIQKIYPGDPNPGTFFGRFVALQDNFAFISAYQDFENGSSSGSLYIYKKHGNLFVQNQKLFPDDGGVEEYFGYSLASYGNWIITGAHHDSDFGASSGKAYILKRNQQGLYDFFQILTAPDAAEADEFGKTVDIYGEYAVSCSYLDDDSFTNSGSVYVYKYNGTKWKFFQKLQAENPVDHAQFGLALNIFKNKLIIGAPYTKNNNEPEGRAYVFELNNEKWEQTEILFPVELDKNDEFGITVKITDNHAFVSALKDDDMGKNSGAVYVYEKLDNNWNLQQKLIAPDGEAGDGFGIEIEPYNDYIYIGSYFDNDNGENSGSVYIFKSENNNWKYYSKFLPGDSDESDAFGASISCSENEILVGAYSDDDNGFFSGATYLFSKEKILSNRYTISRENNYSVYPIVFNDLLTIKNFCAEAFDIEVFNIGGNKVFEKKQILSSVYFLHSNKFNNGVYLIKISGKTRKIFKVIKGL